MKYSDYSSMQNRHNEILALYKSVVPIHRQGGTGNLIRLMLFVCWCYIWIESALRYYGLNYVDFDVTNPRFYIMSLIILAASTYVFKPYKIVSDKGFFGKIEKIQRETEVVGNKKRLSRREIFVLTIRKNNGKLTEKKLAAFHHFNDVYKIDSSVSCVVGIKLPVPMDTDTLCGNHFCTKCGSFEPENFRYCALCHSRLWYK